MHVIERKSREVVILVFDNVEVLDFAGPFEVFSVAKEIGGAEHNIKLAAVTVTVSNNDSSIPHPSLSPSLPTKTTFSFPPLIRAKNGLQIQPDVFYSDLHPNTIDILIVPGGEGTRRLMSQKPLLDWLQLVNESAEMIASVCTGSLLLGSAGILSSLSHTMTHSSAIGILKSLLPASVNVTHAGGDRYTDADRILTSGGISSGIDLSLHIIRRLYGEECVMKTRQHMEYYADCYGTGYMQVIAGGPINQSQPITLTENTTKRNNNKARL